MWLCATKIPKLQPITTGRSKVELADQGLDVVGHLRHRPARRVTVLREPVAAKVRGQDPPTVLGERVEAGNHTEPSSPARREARRAAAPPPFRDVKLDLTAAASVASRRSTAVRTSLPVRPSR